jgi:hypothetical protein
MKVAVLQSSYMPWKGYFDLMHDAELFIFYDDVQFTKNDWRNRNKIKTPNGPMWLSIPVGDVIHRRIDEVAIIDGRWQEKHWKSIKQNYSKAPYFKSEFGKWLENVYMNNMWTNLSHLNQSTMLVIAQRFLGIQAKFASSSEYSLQGHKEDRLLDLLMKVGCKDYYCGPASRNYIELEKFRDAGINVVFKDTNYPVYKQVYEGFDAFVSIIDLLMCAGTQASDYIWGWRKE